MRCWRELPVCRVEEPPGKHAGQPAAGVWEAGAGPALLGAGSER